MHTDSVSVTDAPEEKHLAWLGVQRKLLEERFCFAERLVGLTSHSIGEWLSRQRESKQKDKIRVSMARCVTEGSIVRLEWWMMNLESKVYVSRGSITSNFY